MRASYFFTALMMSCFIFLQCSSSKIMPNQTSNDLDKLLKKLQKDPADTRSADLFTAGYQKIQLQHLGSIKELEKDQSVLSTEAILKRYDALQQLYNSVQSIPGLTNKVKPYNYADKVENFKNKLIRELESESDQLLKLADKNSCRRSYFNLLKLRSYQANNNDEEKLRKSLQCASLNISITEPVMDNRFSHYNAELGNFYKDLLTRIKSNKEIPFVNLSPDPEAEELVQFNFTQFEIGSVTKDNTSREVVNNQPYTSGGRRGGTTGVPPSSATITTTRIVSVSVADIQMEIKNNEGIVINKQEFNSRYEWNNEQNTFSGDRRALTSNDRAQLRNAIKNPPTDTEIVNELLKQLTQKVIAYLQDRYARL